jgi:predicted MFS family arabinose efflux permease
VPPTTAAFTYRSLFAIAEFRVLFFNRCLVVISVAASGLALATITYQATGSAVLSGLSMFGGPLVALVVSPLLLASSDRVRPRTALMYQMGAALASDALQLVPGMPWQARFGLMAIPYVAYAMFAGTRWVLVREIVPEGSYILARSLMNLADGGMQVVGYGVGGLALLWLSPRGLFLFAALADLLALAGVRLGIRARPARTARRRNVVNHTAAVTWQLFRSDVTRPLYIALWVPNGLIVGCESLFVPYGHSGSAGHAAAAGWLFAATAAGMAAGDLLVGRFVPPRRRDLLIGPLRLLLAVPYLFFFLDPPVAIAVPLGLLAAVGYASSLPLQDRLIRSTDDAIQGQVLGLHMNGVMVGQAIGALIAGVVASWMSPAAAMATMAAASTAVTLLLVPGLRRSAPARTPPSARCGRRPARRPLPKRSAGRRAAGWR